MSVVAAAQSNMFERAHEYHLDSVDRIPALPKTDNCPNSVLKETTIALHECQRVARDDPEKPRILESLGHQGAVAVRLCASLYLLQYEIQFGPVEPTVSQQHTGNTPRVSNIGKRIGVQQHEIRCLPRLDTTETLRLAVEHRDAIGGYPQRLHSSESYSLHELLQ